MTQPNLLIVHWHDLGRYLGTYGAQVATPHVDGLAQRGVVFEQAFAVSPLCSPARGALFTGRYPHSNGLMGLSHLGWELNANEVTLPMYFADAGYDTYLVGMQHETSDPATLGYAEVQNLNAPEQYADPVAALAAIKIRQLDAHRPFLLTVGFFEPHRPWLDELYTPVDPAEVTVPVFLPDTPAVRAELAAFSAAVQCADRATGAVLAALETAGFADNTVVLFTTDHGIAFPGAKSTLHDGGIEVSLAIAGPGIEPGRYAGLVSHVDVVPTLLDLFGIPVPPHVQGTSFADRLRAGSTAAERRAVYAEKNWHDPDDYDPVRAVRTRDYKYIHSFEDRESLPLPGDIAAGGAARSMAEQAHRPRAAYELYDLREDPAEQVNLAGDPALAGTRADLEQALTEWMEATADPLLHGPIARPRSAGHLPGPVCGRPAPRTIEDIS